MRTASSSSAASTCFAVRPRRSTLPELGRARQKDRANADGEIKRAPSVTIRYDLRFTAAIDESPDTGKPNALLAALPALITGQPSGGGVVADRHRGRLREHAPTAVGFPGRPPAPGPVATTYRSPGFITTSRLEVATWQDPGAPPGSTR